MTIEDYEAQISGNFTGNNTSDRLIVAQAIQDSWTAPDTELIQKAAFRLAYGLFNEDERAKIMQYFS